MQYSTHPIPSHPILPRLIHAICISSLPLPSHRFRSVLISFGPIPSWSHPIPSHPIPSHPILVPSWFHPIPSHPIHPCIPSHQRAAAQKAAAERAAAEALVSTWDEQRPCFYFVHRDTILSCQTTSLPCMQQLRDSDQLVEERIDIESAFRGGGLIVKVLFVSHRWEAPGAPDGQGAQLKEVQRHLEKNPGVELVWFDFWCMPQGERTIVEEKMFRLMLSAIADLYLTARVLILLDNSYSSRFWTLFEAWSSMMTATADGVRTAEPSERRFTIRCIHNANPKYAIPQLLDLLSSKTPQEIHATLAKPDVVVTNARDKDAMLPVVHSTNERVKTIFANMHQQSPELGCIADSSLAALAAEALRIAVATPIDAVLDEEDDL